MNELPSKLMVHKKQSDSHKWVDVFFKKKESAIWMKAQISISTCNCYIWPVWIPTPLNPTGTDELFLCEKSSV